MQSKNCTTPLIWKQWRRRSSTLLCQVRVLLTVCPQMARGGNGNDGQLWSEPVAARCLCYCCAAAVLLLLVPTDSFMGCSISLTVANHSLNQLAVCFNTPCTGLLWAHELKDLKATNASTLQKMQTNLEAAQVSTNAELSTCGTIVRLKMCAGGWRRKESQKDRTAAKVASTASDTAGWVRIQRSYMVQ